MLFRFLTQDQVKTVVEKRFHHFSRQRAMFSLLVGLSDGRQTDLGINVVFCESMVRSVRFLVVNPSGRNKSIFIPVESELALMETDL